MRLQVMEKIASLPLEERPREKLLYRGVSSLTDSELMAVIIGSGIKQRGVEQITASVLELFDKTNGLISATRLIEVSGIGKAKATLILAALEFARRILCPSRHRIGFPKDVLPLIAHFNDRKQEQFICLSLNGAHEVLAIRIVSIGLVNKALVHPREVFADPLGDRAAAVIIAHNHPSGNVEPSPEDRQVTDKIRKAAEILGLSLLDHIIFSEGSYYSFLEHGEI